MPRLRALIAGLRDRLNTARPKFRNAGRTGTILISLCALAFIWIDIAHHLASDKADARRAALQNGSNLARTFEEHIVRALVDSDQTLIDLRRAYVQDPSHFDISQWARQNHLFSDMLQQVSIIGSDGYRIATNIEAAGEGAYLGDREYFQVLKQATGDEIVVSKPVVGRATGKWSIPLARAILGPDGSFGGVVTASLDPHYLSRFYDTVDVGQHGVVVLVGTDGVIRARASMGGATMGQSLAGSALFQAFAAQPVGSFRTDGVIDGVARIFSYRKVKGFPLLVEVGFSESEIYEHYRENLTQYVAVAALLSLLLVAATVFLVGHHGRLQKTQHALSASERKYRSVVEGLNEIVFETDLEGHLRFLNPTWSAVLGFSVEESIGRAVASYLDPRDLPLFREKRRAMLDGKADRNRYDVRAVAKDGSTHWVEVAVRPIRDEAGNVVGVTGSLNDITLRKWAENELRAARDRADSAARAKSDFLAMMSHEIRSPMNGVMGILDLLGDTPLNPDQRQMVDLTRESATSLLGIINDILDFSKIEAGALAIGAEATHLKRLVKSVRESMAFSASERGLTLEMDLGPDLPDYIDTDPVRLRQILVNLLSNAVKFTAHGSVRLKVARTKSPAGAERIKFSVIDTGIGMAPEVVGRLFEPFMQADASTTRTFGGTGLGLSISHRLARMMSGDLRVTSEPDVGSTFTLELPLVVSDGPAPAAAEDGGAPAAVASAGAHVLVAEDMATNRWVIKRQLQRLGLTADMAENGASALQALSAGGHDALITDVHMPDMDGISLARLVRETEAREGARRLPIIGLTADVTREMRTRCLASGMDEVLAKPTNLKQLSEALSRLLAGEAPGESPAAAEPRAVTFDEAVYRELFAPGEPEGRAWLEDFLQAAEALVRSLTAHAASGEREALVQTAHRLAGTALSAGAVRLGGLCRALETAAPAGGLNELQAQASCIAEEFDLARSEIIRFLSLTVEPVS